MLSKGKGTNTRISVVTPTFGRPDEVRGLLDNLSRQLVLPAEVILVDGAPESVTETERVADSVGENYPFHLKYIRSGRGTAVQRNVGIGAVRGELIAFVDDDVRLDTAFLFNVVETYAQDANREIGGIVGYRRNQYFDSMTRERWRWYRRLRLLSTYTPGRYDFECGYPINNNMQPPFSGTRPVDFMTTACAVWRKEVFDSGLRFDPFFTDYGVLEDAHFSLRAGRHWKLLQSGDALCDELHSPNGRVSSRKIGLKSVANYYYVFRDIAGPLTSKQKYRFWRFQAFELFRIASSALRRRRWTDVMELVGRIEGILSIRRLPVAVRTETPNR